MSSKEIHHETDRISSKAVKRPRSLLETPCSSGESDLDFLDDTDKDPDWIGETQSKCPFSADEDDKLGATEGGQTRNRKKRKKEKRTKEKKRKKIHKREVETDVYEKSEFHNEATFTCHICDKMWESKSALHQHIKLSHESGKKGFNCHVCGKKVKNRGNLTQHVQSHKHKEALICHICNKEWKSKYALSSHMKCHKPGDVVVGKICNKKFNQKGLSSHVTSHTPEAGQVEDCHICNKEFKSKAGLSSHLSSHKSGDFDCHICNKKLKSKGALCRHMLTHDSGNHRSRKRETCDTCLRVINNDSMKAHTNGHDKDESCQTTTGVHKCLNCLKCYDDILMLRRHRSSYCPLNAAGESDATTGNISTGGDDASKGSSHLPAHSGHHSKSSLLRKKYYLSRFKCPNCTAVFASFEYLQIHNRAVHINKRLGVYKCEVCQKGFGDQQLLNRHKHDRHGKLKFKCPYCIKIFPSKWFRQQHERQVHKKHICEHCGTVVKHEIFQRRHKNGECVKQKNQQQSRKNQTANTCKIASEKTSLPTGITDMDQNQEESAKMPANVAECSSTISKVSAESWPESQQTKDVTSSNYRIPKSEIFRCKTCFVSFESKDNYVMHKRTHHNENAANESQMETKVCQCPECPEICRDKVKLCAHEAVHKFVTCPDCHENVPDEETLELHILLECPDKLLPQKIEAADEKTEHTENEPGYSKISQVVRQANVCEICGRKLKTLTLHENNHVKDRQMQSESGRYHCPYCLKRYDSKISLGQHKQRYCHLNVERSFEEKKYVYICKICRKEIDNCQLSKHQMMHTEDQHHQSETGRFECPRCHKHYEVNGHLSHHMKHFCPKLDFACCVCPAEFEDAVLLSIHKMVHVIHIPGQRDGAKSKGDSSDDGGDDSNELPEMHSKEKGAKSKQMGISTQVAAETTSQEENDISVDSSTGIMKISKNICNICNVEFSSAAVLAEHHRRVSLTKSMYPHNCPLCPREERNQNLVMSACDYLQHKKHFLYICQFCGWHFEDSKCLARHINKFHDYENKKECPGCHRMFGPQAFMQHVDYNRKEVERLNYKCLSCGKVFDSVKALDGHNNRCQRNVCDICSQHFKFFRSLKVHKMEYHNVEPPDEPPIELPKFLCKHCSNIFDKASQLSAHVKSVLEEESSESLLCSWEYKYSTCLRCGVSFTKLSDYKIHRSVWRIECDMCHEHFDKLGLFRNHHQGHYLQVKTGEETRSIPEFQKCKYCAHSFALETDKRKHEAKTEHENNTQMMQFPLPCRGCGEMLDTKCQLHIHKMRHKNKEPIISCRFCCMEFTLTGPSSLTRHARRCEKDRRCQVCDGKVLNSCHLKVHKERHLKEKNAKEKVIHKNLLCVHCGTEFKNKAVLIHVRRFYGSESTPKTVWCSVCCKGIAICQLITHRKHVEDKVNGRHCSYCSETILTTQKAHQRFHQRFQEIVFLCSCGLKIRSRCEKERHEARHQFVCYKCGGHFESYENLITHLIKYNYANVVNAVADQPGGSSKKTLVKKETWCTIEKNGETSYVCLHCNDEVETEQEKTEHTLTFKFECLLCMKHFRTSLAAVHHFKEVHHDVRRISKGTQGHSKVGCPKGTKNSTKNSDDILSVYLLQSVCDEFVQHYKEKEHHSERGAMEFQIGSEVYSVLTDNTAEVNTDIVMDEIKAPIECPLSRSSDTPQRSDVHGVNRPTPVVNHDVPPGPDANTSTGTGKSPETTPHLKDICETTGKNYHKTNRIIYHCPCCKKDIHPRSYQRHFTLEDTKGLLYTCVKCDRSFEVMCGLAYHILRMCEYCGRHFSSMESKVDHEEGCKSKTEMMNNRIVCSDEIKQEECEEDRDMLVAYEKDSRLQSMEVKEMFENSDGTEEDMEIVPEAKSIVVTSGNESKPQAMMVKDMMEKVNKSEKRKEETEIMPKARGMSVFRCEDDEKPNVNEDVTMTGRPSRVLKRKQNKSVKISLSIPATKGAEEKCDFCLQMAKLHKNKPPCGNLPCYQNDPTLKWMKCVCLHCNLELPTKCQINYHLARYTRSRKHFKGHKDKTGHSSHTYMCQHCNIIFGSIYDLEAHKANWHKIVYKETHILQTKVTQSRSTDEVIFLDADMNPQNKEIDSTTRKDEVIPQERNTQQRLVLKISRTPEGLTEPIVTSQLKPTQVATESRTATKQEMAALPTHYLERTSTGLQLKRITQQGSMLLIPAELAPVQPIPAGVPKSAGLTPTKLAPVHHNPTQQQSVSAGAPKRLTPTGLAPVHHNSTQQQSVSAGAPRRLTPTKLAPVHLNPTQQQSGSAGAPRRLTPTGLVPVHHNSTQQQSVSAGAPRRLTPTKLAPVHHNPTQQQSVSAGAPRRLTPTELAPVHLNPTQQQSVSAGAPRRLTPTGLVPVHHNSTQQQSVSAGAPRKLTPTKLAPVHFNPTQQQSVSAGAPRRLTPTGLVPVHHNSTQQQSVSAGALRKLTPTKLAPVHHNPTQQQSVSAGAPRRLTPTGLVPVHHNSTQQQSVSAGAPRKLTPTKLAPVHLNPTQQQPISAGTPSRLTPIELTPAHLNPIQHEPVSPGAPKGLIVGQRTLSPLPLVAEARHPTVAATHFEVVPDGLIGLADIMFGAEETLVTSKLLTGDKTANHYVESVTINDQNYLTFKHPANYTGELITLNARQFIVAIGPTSPSKSGYSGDGCSHALVVKIGHLKVSCMQMDMDSLSCRTYRVDLT